MFKFCGAQEDYREDANLKWLLKSINGPFYPIVSYFYDVGIFWLILQVYIVSNCPTQIRPNDPWGGLKEINCHGDSNT